MTATVGFFVATFAVTWALWAIGAAVAGAVDAHLWSSLALREVLYLPGTIAPGVVAVVIAVRAQGPAAANAMLKRIVAWRVPARWYFFAVLYLVSAELVAAAGYRAIEGDWPAIDFGSWYVMIPAIAMSMWVQAGEELGWRGFALPRLAGELGLARASLVLGAIWATWHLPLFFIPGGTTTGQSFILYSLQVVPLSVAVAFLYWRTHGSLLLVMVMHASVNNTTGIVQTAGQSTTHVLGLGGSLLSWLTTGVMWIAASYFIIQMRGVYQLEGMEPPSA